MGKKRDGRCTGSGKREGRKRDSIYIYIAQKNKRTNKQTNKQTSKQNKTEQIKDAGASKTGTGTGIKGYKKREV